MMLPSMREATLDDCAEGRHVGGRSHCRLCGVQKCDSGYLTEILGCCTLPAGHEGPHRSMWVELDREWRANRGGE